jgi:hypothetical protein
VRLLRVTSVCAVIAMAGLLAVAGHQQTVRHGAFAAFMAGEVKNVAVLGKGALELGPELKAYEGMAARAFVWALAADSKGRVYAATGNDGQVLRVDGAKAATVLKTDDLLALCLAVDKDDNVYAGCAPSGRIYKIDANGKSSVFCETGQTYVWSLAVAESGHLYAATGPEGKILRISPGGRNVATVYDSDEKHILGLAVSGKNVYACTGDNGLVYKIAADGKVSVAFDSDKRELRCMTADPAGNIYFASADGVLPTPGRAPSRGRRVPPVPPKKTGSGSAAATGSKNSHTSKRPPSTVKSARPGGRGVLGGNTVFRLAPDGKVKTVFTMSRVAFVSMIWHKGALYCGTAGDGQIFRIRSERDAAALVRLEQPEVLALCALPNGKLFAGTGNDGRIFTAEDVRAKTGTYTSVVHDAKYRSTWGAMHLTANTPEGTKVELATRSGNVAKADKTWSAWTKPRRIDGREPVTSPAARFIQYRLTLSTNKAAITPQVLSVDFPYLPDNHAPSIDSIDVSAKVKARPNGKKNGKKPAAPAAPRNGNDGVVSGTVTVAWRAHDPNKDTLEFALYFRGRGEKNWKLLDDEMGAKTFAWDTEAAPDGAYELRVTATDKADNPPPRALNDELVSRIITIDNSPPNVRIKRVRVRAGRCEIEAEVKDAGSVLTQARYSVDAGPWQAALPADAIFDAKAETLTLKTDVLKPGEHTLVIQAEDSAGNVGAAKTVFEVNK